MIQTFSDKNFKRICKQLAKKDTDLAAVLDKHGHPPMWIRSNSFESLVHIILEQQVSLASALAALKKLQEFTKGITPGKILRMDDKAMRACYVSRQKMIYIRGVAKAIADKQLDLDALTLLSDDMVRAKLTALKGIGHWTVDVYLMFVLQRTDIFPSGDLAAVNALKQLKALAAATPKDTLITLAAGWAPYRTVATMILWHHYLSERRKNGQEHQ